MKIFNEKPVPREGRMLLNPKPNNIDGLTLIGLNNNLYVNTYGLTGLNMNYAIVDGGSVLQTHQEFTNPNRVQLNDGTTTSAHATHVAGTSAAKGFDPSAKGCVPEATIHSYTYNDPYNNINTCGANGYNVVNNSWG